LKKPDATHFSKKNQIHPFDDAGSLEFFSEKQDASLLVVASHSKKRPDHLTFVRMFEYKVLDMVEMGVTNYRPCTEFKVRTTSLYFCTPFLLLFYCYPVFLVALVQEADGD
jgi:ribosome production factor 2